ncbi:hypothetical protein V8E36_005243 [Tilletia maclaganii]
MSTHQADLSGSIHATPRSTTSTATSAAAVAAVANLDTGGNGPALIALDLRPASLHESALSPSEHAVFPIWLSDIKAAPSGQPGLYDEHDALNFLRRDCGIEVEEEIQILSLFERTPRGMTAGHVYALMRLASWVKAGQAPTRRLLFTQAPPLKLKKLPPQSPPKPIGLKSDLAAPTRYPTAAPPQTPTTASYPRSTTAFSSAPHESTGSVLNKPTPALPPAAMGSSSAMPQPGPSAMSMYGSRAGASTVQPASTPVLPPPTGVDALLGFDSAPDPFKQAAGSAQTKPPQQFQTPPAPVLAPPPRPQQPLIVKPTPVAAFNPSQEGDPTSLQDRPNWADSAPAAKGKQLSSSTDKYNTMGDKNDNGKRQACQTLLEGEPATAKARTDASGNISIRQAAATTLQVIGTLNMTTPAGYQELSRKVDAISEQMNKIAEELQKLTALVRAGERPLHSSSRDE